MAPKKLVGVTRPRLWTPPLRPLTKHTSKGFEAAAFAERIGEPFMPWQRWVTIHALETIPGGDFRFRVVLVLVSRQNGKSQLKRTISLWRMYMERTRLILGVAQDVSLAREQWNMCIETIRNCPELAAELDGKPRHVNGDEWFRLVNGSRYKIAAANRSAGRGLSIGELNIDELREQRSWDAWSALSKDLPNSTPMLRADGSWTTMGELAVGDRIFAPSGKPVTVTAVHPVTELRPMYRVTTTDGRRLVASESHLWTVRDDRESHDPTMAWKTLTTGQILAAGLRYKKAGALRWRMPVQHPLADLPERDLPIDPYVLGAWLGDGTTDDGTLTVGRFDLEAQIEALTGAGATVTSRIETRPGTWRIRLHVGGRPLRVALRDAALLGHKHIPGEYLAASTEQRLALLSGLLDTDGGVTTGGDVSFTNKLEDVATAVQFLARSLGWNARLNCFRATIGGRDCGPSWRVTFCLRDGDLIPFRLPRKANRWTQRPYVLRGTGILSIEPVDTEPSACIAVDSDDHLFLAGRDLVPTHNTTMAVHNSQIWCMSNAGDDESVVLNSLRDAALSGRDPSIGIFEYSGLDGCELDDWEQIRQANPALGLTVSEAAIKTAMTTDPPGVFRTEVLCQKVDMIDAAIDAQRWADCADPSGTLEAHRKRITACFDVALDGQHATLAVATLLPDGRVRVEIAAAWASTDHARGELGALLDRIRPVALGWYPAGPAAALAPILRARPGAMELTGGKVGEACQGLADLTKALRVVHPADPLLDSHIKGASKLNSGDGWRFTRHGGGHVDAAYAAAGAVKLAQELPPAKRARVRIIA